MTRRLDNWLLEFLKFHENVESSEQFLLWTGISILCGTLERRCYMRWGKDIIYPNEYIILVGDSGRARKGGAMGAAKRFTQAAEITVASASITTEALIKQMDAQEGHFFHNFRDENGEFKNQTPVMIISDELAVFIGQKDVKFLAVLTDWYDSHDVWGYDTKNKGKYEALGVCLNILGATAPDWLPSMLPEEAVGGGFTSRCILVTGTEKRIIPDPNIYGENEQMFEDLAYDLHEIKKLVGEYTFTRQAYDAYIAWYTDYETKFQKGHSPVADPKFNGYVARRATHVKKICMALEAAKTDNLEIGLETFETAVRLLESVEKKMPQAFGGLGTARFATITENVLTYIAAKQKVSRSQLLRAFYRDLDMYMLEQIEQLLGNMHAIRVEIDAVRSDVIYHYQRME